MCIQLCKSKYIVKLLEGLSLYGLVSSFYGSHYMHKKLQFHFRITLEADG